MNCEEMRSQLVDYLDGELPPAEQEALASHLQACASCQELAARLEQSLAVFQAVIQTEPAPEAVAVPQIADRTQPNPFSRRLVGWMALAATLLLILGAGVYFRLQSATPTTAVLEPGVRLNGEKLEVSLSGENFVLHGHGISPRNRLDLKL